MTVVESLLGWGRVFGEIGDAPLLLQIGIPWILALALSRFPSIYVRCCVSGVEGIAAPSLALHVIVPFGREVHHARGVIHVHDGVAAAVVLEFRELQTVDGVLHHGRHIGCSHILVGIGLIG